MLSHNRIDEIQLVGESDIVPEKQAQVDSVWAEKGSDVKKPDTMSLKITVSNFDHLYTLLQLVWCVDLYVFRDLVVRWRRRCCANLPCIMLT